MKKRFTTNTINFLTVLKAFSLGLILAETFFLSVIIGEKFVKLAEFHKQENWIWWLAICYVFALLFLLLRKDFWKKLWLMVLSWRFDLLILLTVGIYFMYVFQGHINESLSSWIEMLSWQGLKVILLLPFFVILAQVVRLIQTKLFLKEDPDSLFISDKEGQNKKDDGLGFLDQAEQFAESVFNQGSSESLVFGIDAPWGTGKSSL